LLKVSDHELKVRKCLARFDRKTAVYRARDPFPSAALIQRLMGKDNPPNSAWLLTGIYKRYSSVLAGLRLLHRDSPHHRQSLRTDRLRSNHKCQINDTDVDLDLNRFIFISSIPMTTLKLFINQFTTQRLKN
jgi:hypothetical protein